MHTEEDNVKYMVKKTNNVGKTIIVTPNGNPH